ncbi:MAG: hypothetical protein IBX40_10505 [Methanosarcinales archaeon]|nr:hypothetical protein [Methanosarcinales archaeon]
MPDEPHLIPSPHYLHCTIQQHFLYLLLKRGYGFDIQFWVDLLRFWRHGVINPVEIDNAGFDADIDHMYTLAVKTSMIKPLS